MERHTITPAGLIPTHLFNGLREYVVMGLKPGGFLTSVLCNDLSGAVQRAHGPTAFLSLPALVMFVNNFCPTKCWGSMKKIEAWTHQNLRGNHFVDLPDGYEFHERVDDNDGWPYVLGLLTQLKPEDFPDAADYVGRKDA